VGGILAAKACLRPSLRGMRRALVGARLVRARRAPGPRGWRPGPVSGRTRPGYDGCIFAGCRRALAGRRLEQPPPPGFRCRASPLALRRACHQASSAAGGVGLAAEGNCFAAPSNSFDEKPRGPPCPGLSSKAVSTVAFWLAILAAAAAALRCKRRRRWPAVIFCGKRPAPSTRGGANVRAGLHRSTSLFPCRPRAAASRSGWFAAWLSTAGIPSQWPTALLEGDSLARNRDPGLRSAAPACISALDRVERAAALGFAPNPSAIESACRPTIARRPALGGGYRTLRLPQTLSRAQSLTALPTRPPTGRGLSRPSPLPKPLLQLSCALY